MRWFVSFIFFWAFGTSYALATGLEAGVGFTPDPGTYKTVTVKSTDICRSLCETDSKCRGMQAYQQDITIDEMQCYLNDGLSEGSAFTIKAPDPIDLATAVSDLNNYRAQYGLNPISLNMKLVDASDSHAKDLAIHGIISHTGTDGSSHSERAKRAGYFYTIIAENVATGQNSWDEVFQAWQDSPGHNENLLLPDVTEFGVALAHDPTTQYKNYWAMLVGAPLDKKYFDQDYTRADKTNG